MEDMFKKNDHSSYYDVGGLSLTEIWKAKLTKEELCGLFKGNALKYIVRAGNKANNSASKDIAKAIDYLTDLKAVLDQTTFKKYQVIFQDEYNNLFEVGIYDNLDDAIKDVNGYLTEDYNKLEKGDLFEYSNTFGPTFDKEIVNKDETAAVYVRGFIKE